MDFIKKEACKIALNNLFKDNCFSICTIDNLSSGKNYSGWYWTCLKEMALSLKILKKYMSPIL